MPTLDEIHDALMIVTWSDRWEMRELYVKVDAILADPNRERRENSQQPFLPLFEMVECPWCGEFNPSNAPYCNRECLDAHKHFKNKRRGAECAWCGESLLKHRKYCNLECWEEHREFNKRRKAAGLKPT